VLVRQAGRALAGGVSFEQGGTAGIYLVATHPEARRQGLAGLVMQGLHADARARGCTVAVLQASPLGHGLYQRLGYRDVGAWTSWVRRAG
jgi:predicted GNAT family acetyltransferase